MTACVLVTGATGLVGRRVIEHLIAGGVDRVYGLVRCPTPSVARVELVRGDLHVEQLGLAPQARTTLARDVTTVVHVAANTAFSQSLDEARATNLEGTRRLLELSADWPKLSGWIYVSTAFVAGLRTGRIREDDPVPPPGWANAYEQSKAEAEQLVRHARADWVIVRPSTIACDDPSGRISQMNAVHRALRLYFGGLAPMLPGSEQSTVDVVTTDYVARGITRAVVSAPAFARRTIHLCAGDGAMPLEQLLDVSYDAFLRAPAWRRKGIVRPIRTDLETYRLFENAVQDVASPRVRQALQSLSHFVPQLAFPKTFETSGARTLLGEDAPSVASYWSNMIDQLVGNVVRRAA